LSAWLLFGYWVMGNRGEAFPPPVAIAPAAQVEPNLRLWRWGCWRPPSGISKLSNCALPLSLRSTSERTWPSTRYWSFIRWFCIKMFSFLPENDEPPTFVWKVVPVYEKFLYLFLNMGKFLRSSWLRCVVEFRLYLANGLMGLKMKEFLMFCPFFAGLFFSSICSSVLLLLSRAVDAFLAATTYEYCYLFAGVSYELKFYSSSAPIWLVSRPASRRCTWVDPACAGPEVPWVEESPEAFLALSALACFTIYSCTYRLDILLVRLSWQSHSLSSSLWTLLFVW